MRKFLISAAVAASAFAVASPAAAQYYPQPQGNAYGYNASYGQARSLLARVDQIRRQIQVLDSRDRISEREADRLRQQANVLRDRVRRASYNGLSYRERRDIEVRIASLEQRVRRDVYDGNRWGDNRWDNDGRWQDQYGRWHDRQDARRIRYEDDRDDDN